MSATESAHLLSPQEEVAEALKTSHASKRLNLSEKIIKVVAKIVLLTGALCLGGVLGAAIGSLAPIGGTTLGAAMGAGIAFTLAMTLLEKLDRYLEKRAQRRYFAVLYTH